MLLLHCPAADASAVIKASATTCFCSSGGGFSLWGFGSQLVDSVTQNANQFVSTIVETDWQKELADIQKELQGSATNTTTHAAQAHDEHARSASSLAHAAPSDHAADATTPNTETTCRQSRDADASGKAADEVQAAGDAFSFAGFGKTLLAGTAGILEQVRCVHDLLQLYATRHAWRCTIVMVPNGILSVDQHVFGKQL